MGRVILCRYVFGGAHVCMSAVRYTLDMCFIRTCYLEIYALRETHKNNIYTRLLQIYGYNMRLVRRSYYTQLPLLNK